MENEISVLIGLAVVAGVIYFYKKNDKKSSSGSKAISTPVSEQNQPKRGPGSTPKKTSQKKAPAKAKKAAPAKAKKAPAKAKKATGGKADPKLKVLK